MHRNRVLGLTLTDKSIAAVLTEDGDQVGSLVASLAVDVFAGDPQLAAQELRERLAPLGRIPRRCRVCLSSEQVMVTSLALPRLPEQDIPGFVALEVERQLQCRPEEILTASSRYGLDDDCRGVTVFALAADRYASLVQALNALGCRQVQVCVGSALWSLPREPRARRVQARLLVLPDGVDMTVTAGPGLALVRRVAGSTSAHAGALDHETVLREVRLSLNQLPTPIRELVTVIEMEGPRDAVQSLARSAEGSTLPPVRPLESEGARTVPLPDLRLAWATRAASVGGNGTPLPLALTPPIAGQTEQNWARRNRRQIVLAAVAALLVVLVIAAGPLLQWRRLARAQTQWEALAPRVETLEAIADQARGAGPWTSDQAVSLRILRTITLAFPETGSVWLTRLSVKNSHEVSMTGQARSREAWLAVLDSLKASPAVADLRAPQARTAGGNSSALTFTASFTWVPVQDKASAAPEPAS